jgi:hypothetical protein
VNTSVRSRRGLASVAHLRSRGDGLACGPMLARIGQGQGWQKSSPEAERPATDIAGDGPGSRSAFDAN